jgi:hypothetical protein
MTLDAPAKWLAGMAASAYVLGVLLTNLALFRFGAADFSALRPRAVVVGLAFLFYIALPLLLFAGPLAAALRWLPTRPLWLRVMAPSVGTLVLAKYLPVPFIYFIPHLHPFAVSERWLRFWAFVYGNEFLALTLVALVLPAMLLGASVRVAFLARVRPILLLVFGLGVFGHTYPYVLCVAYSVASEVGGFLPRVVYLVPASDQSPLVTAIKTRLGADLGSDPFVLWYESGDTLIVTPAAKGPMEHKIIVMQAACVSARLATSAKVKVRGTTRDLNVDITWDPPREAKP